MRDDRHKWPAVSAATQPDLVRNGIAVRQVTLSRQTVLSGGFEDCLSLIGMESAIGCGPEYAMGETYALRQRRDRVLVVNGPVLADGWNNTHNVAVSDMTAAYAIIELSGSKADQLLATGTEFDGQMISPSVSRLWHGFGILIYRYENSDTYRIHVRHALRTSLWEMIERQVDILSDIWMEETPSAAVANVAHGANLGCRVAR